MRGKHLKYGLFPVPHRAQENHEAEQTRQTQSSKRSGQTFDLLSPTLHHLSEQRDAIQVDELLCKGDVPGRIGQVLEGLQLGVHAR